MRKTCGLLKKAADAVGAVAALGGRSLNACSLAGLDAAQHPCHVAGQIAHDLHALLVLGGLLGIGAVDHGPVGGVDQRHLIEGGNLHHGVQGADGTGAAGAGHHGGRLVAQIPPGGVGQPVHEAQHAGGGSGIVHRRAENDAVRLLDQGQHIHHRAAEDALTSLGAAAAAHTAAHRGPADVEDGGLDAFLVEDLGHLGESSIGAALFVRAAVDQKYFHGISSLRFSAGSPAAVTVAAIPHMRNRQTWSGRGPFIPDCIPIIAPACKGQGQAGREQPDRKGSFFVRTKKLAIRKRACYNLSRFSPPVQQQAG